MTRSCFRSCLSASAVAHAGAFAPPPLIVESGCVSSDDGAGPGRSVRPPRVLEASCTQGGSTPSSPAPSERVLLHASVRPDPSVQVSWAELDAAAWAQETWRVSTLAYGALTRKREAASAGTSTTTAPPAVKTYVDALTALVPAEVLALHAFIIDGTTETKKNAAGESVTTITDPGTLKWVFWVLLGVTVVFYLGAHKRRYWDVWDVPRALVPPAAFVLWMILQKTTAFDAVWPDALPGGARQAIGAIGAVVLGLIAGRLGVKADQEPPP